MSDIGPGGGGQVLPYRDRGDAGRHLAEALRPCAGEGALVLGIPRGGLVVAAEVARRLRGDLDIIVARKLGAPGHAELAIGAVTAAGGRFLNESVIRSLGVPKAWVESATAKEMAEARRREARYRAGRGPRPIRGRTVIVVDDGLATGATLRAAVRHLLHEGPERLLVGVPVGSRSACGALAGEADAIVCPWVPRSFDAVGDFYLDFDPVADAEVERLLLGFEGAGAPQPAGRAAGMAARGRD